MTKFYILSLSSLLLLGACSTQNGDLIGKWKQVSEQNSLIEQTIKDMSLIIDTMTDKSELVRSGQFASVEEAKNLLRGQLDTVIAMNEERKISGSNTFLEFKKDGQVKLTTLDGESTSNWKIEEDMIVVDDAEQTGTYMISKFKILSLSKDSLALRLVVERDTSITTYKKTK